MKVLVILFYMIFKCDNEEFAVNNVDNLYVFNHKLDLSKNNNFNSIKMSFGPQHLFRFKLQNRNLIVYDNSVYYKSTIPFKIRIDYEQKYYGTPLFVYKIIAFTSVCVFIQTVLFYTIFADILMK